MVESNKPGKGSSSARRRSQQKRQPTQIVTQTPIKNQAPKKKLVVKKQLKMAPGVSNQIVREDVKRSLRDMLIIQAIKMDAVTEQEFTSNAEDQSCNAPSYDLEGVWDGFQVQAMERLQLKSVFAKVIASPIIWKSLTFLVIENQNMQKIFSYIQICIELKAVFLSGNQIITRDLPYIKHLVNLRKADLSNNKIHFLPDDCSLEKLTKLQFLLLHRNQIVGWQQLDYLLAVKQLRLLTCHSNPCTKIIGSREHIIDGIPQLWVLDDVIVSDFERKKFVDLNLDQSKVTLIRFTPQQYPFFSVPPPKKNIQKALEEEHYKLRRAFEYTSPFLTIQKTWRMWSQKMRYNRIKRHMKILFWATTRYYKRWFYRKLVLNQKLTFLQLKKIGHVRRIQKQWRAYWRKKLLRDVYSVKLQSIYRMNRAQKKVPLDLYTDDLTLILTETDADEFCLGGVAMPGVYIYKNLKRCESFLLGNIKMTMWQVGLKPIRCQDENITVSRFSNLKPKRTPRTVKSKKKIPKQRAVCLVKVTFDQMADLNWRYNRILKMRNMVCVYPQKILNRVLAAIRVQSWWKGVMLRKIKKSIFKDKRRLLTKIDWKNVSLAKTKYYQFVAVLRAAVVIQKCFKSMCFRSRVNALTQICQHVKQISNEPLYLEQNLYLNIEQIIRQCSTVKLQERKFHYQTIDGVVFMRSQVKRYQQTVLPNWFLEEVGFNIPLIPDNMKNKKDPSILAVLHSQSNLQEATVVDSSQLQLECKTVRKFVKFQFKSIEECQKIACLIALLTCQYLKGATHFVHLVQKDQICESDSNIEALLLEYKLRDIDEIFVLRNTKEQLHDGIINKKKDPYANQLRSRPRQNARDKGQLIILKDADPQVVELELKKAVTKQMLIRAEEGAVSLTIAQKIESSNLISGAYQSHTQAILEKPQITKKEQAQQKQVDEKKEVQRFKLQLLNKKLKDLEQKVEQEVKQIQSLENYQLNESQSQKFLLPAHFSGHASIDIKQKRVSKSPASLNSRKVSADRPPTLLVEQKAQKDNFKSVRNQDLPPAMTYEQQKEIMVLKIKELQKQREDKEQELSRKKFAAKREKQQQAQVNLLHRRESANRLRKSRNSNDSFYITKQDTHSVETDLMSLNTSPQREREQTELEEKPASTSQLLELKSRYYKIVRKNSATKPLIGNSVTNHQGKSPNLAYKSPYKQQEKTLPEKQTVISKTSRPQKGFISESQKQPGSKIEIDRATELGMLLEKTRSLDQNDHKHFLGAQSNRNGPLAMKSLTAGILPEASPVKAVLVFQTPKPQNASESQKQSVPKITIDSVPTEQKKPKIIAQSMSMPDLLSVKHSNLVKNQFPKSHKKILETTPKSFKVEGHHDQHPALSTLFKNFPPEYDSFYKDLKNVLRSPSQQNQLISFNQQTTKKINTAKPRKTTTSHTILPSLKVFENIQLQDLLIAKNLENTKPIYQIEIKTLVKQAKAKVNIPLKSQQMQPMFPNQFQIETAGLHVNQTISMKINNIKKIRQQQVPTTQKNTPRKATTIQTLMLSGTGNRIHAIPTKTKPGQQLKRFGSSGSLGLISNLSEAKITTVNNKRKMPDEHNSSIESFYSEYDSQMYHIQRARLLSAKPAPDKKVSKRNKILPQSTIEHVISQRKENSQKAMKKSKSKIFTARSEKAVYSLMPSKSFLPRINKNSSLARLQSEIINQQIIGDFCRF